MIERKTAIESVEACLKWTENVMLTFDRGYWVVYERIRIDRNERVCHCRPDTSSELARTIYAYERETGNKDLHDVYENQINRLTRVQNENGRSRTVLPRITLYARAFPTTTEKYS